MRGCRSLSDAALCALSSLPQLRRLTLNGTAITDLSLELIGSHCLSLQWLLLRECHGLSSAGVSRLGSLPALALLDVSGCPAVCTDLRPLCSLKSLSTLLLEGCGLTNDSIQLLTGLTNLRELCLKDNPGVTEEGLQVLCHMPRLQQANILLDPSKGPPSLDQTLRRHYYLMERSGVVRFSDVSY